MKIYQVAITEIRRKAVSVRAENKKDAEQRALDGYKNTEFVIDEFDDLKALQLKFLTKARMMMIPCHTILS